MVLLQLLVLSLLTLVWSQQSIDTVSVGTGTDHTLAYSWNGGVSWRGLGNSIFSVSGNAVANNGTYWVAVGEGANHTIATSSDGKNWIGRGNSVFTNSASAVCTNGAMWVVFGSGGNTFAFSRDGVNWNASVTNVFSSVAECMWNGTMWFAVGQGATNTIAYSLNGMNWIGLGKSVLTNDAKRIDWSGSVWVAVGSGTNSIAYSLDGMNWVGLGSTVFSTRGNGICYSSTYAMWIAVGEGDSNSMAYSFDGIIWSGLGRSTFDIGSDCAWSGNYWMAGGSSSNSLAYSKDGIEWVGLGSRIFSDSANMFSASRATPPFSVQCPGLDTLPNTLTTSASASVGNWNEAWKTSSGSIWVTFSALCSNLVSSVVLLRDSVSLPAGVVSLSDNTKPSIQLCPSCNNNSVTSVTMWSHPAQSQGIISTISSQTCSQSFMDYWVTYDANTGYLAMGNGSDIGKNVLLFFTLTGSSRWNVKYFSFGSSSTASSSYFNIEWGPLCSSTASPYVSGCADGTREWFLDLGKHPLIAGCSGAWSSRIGVKLDAQSVIDSPMCDRQAGNTGVNSAGSGCNAADLCAEGWHICDSAVEVVAMSGTNDCDEGSHNGAQLEAAFISAQSSSGSGWCEGQGFDDLWACGIPSSPSSTLLRSLNKCGPLKYAVSHPGQSSVYGWQFPSSSSEAASIYKTDIANGGVMCCKNISSVCPSGMYSAKYNAGCSDGTREWFTDKSSYPNIAGCGGAFRNPGIASAPERSLDFRSCNSSAGNDSPNKSGNGCSAADLCEPGWKICDDADELFVNTYGRFCEGTGSTSVSGSQIYLSALTTGSSTCSFSFDSVSDGYGVGCGNINQGSYCQFGDIGSSLNSYSTNLSFPSSWKLPSGIFNLATIYKDASSGGGVLCCRVRSSFCANCRDPTCSAPIKPTIQSIVPSNGPLIGNIPVTLVGSYFGNDGAVYFNDVACTRLSGQIFTDTKIECYLPSGIGRNTSIYVDSSVTGTGFVYNGFTYDPPFINSISSPSRPTTGGVWITIFGRNFANDSYPATILIGGSLCPEGLHTDSGLTCLLPMGQGNAIMTIEVEGLISLNYTFVYDPPVVYGISSGNSGDTAGGRPVVISGLNLGTTGTVTIDGKTCTVKLWFATSVTCLYPPGSGSNLPLILTTGGFVRSTTYSYGFPTVAYINPKCCGSSSNMNSMIITISGWNFGEAALPVVVLFGSLVVPSSYVTHVDHWTVIVQLPPWFTGSNILKVQLPGPKESSPSCGSACTFGIHGPSILSVKGCVDSGRLTRECTVGGTQNITITGYNFGVVSSTSGYTVNLHYGKWSGVYFNLQTGTRCAFKNYSMFNISLTEYRFNIECTIPRFPSGGTVAVVVGGGSWCGACTLDPGHSCCDWISFRAPIIVNSSLRTCAGSTSPYNITSGIISNLPFLGNTRLCFNVSNLDGATPSDIEISYGIYQTPIFPYGKFYPCTSVQRSDPIVSCVTAPGFGTNLRFIIRVYQQTAHMGSDYVEYKKASFVPTSIRGKGSSSMLDEFRLRSTIGDWVSFDVYDLAIETVRDLWNYTNITYGEPGYPKAYYCTSMTIKNVSASRATFTCRASPGSGSGHVFQLNQLNMLSFESNFTISYPTAPSITSVKGCNDSNRATFDCPTTGGRTLIITGKDMCDFSQNGTCTMQVQIGMVTCTPEFIDKGTFSCPLPQWTGLLVPIMLFQFMDGGIVLTSPSVQLLNYAAANVTSVSGCIDEGITTVKCSRYNSSRLTIYGNEFGVFGARILINGVLCQNLSHDANTPEKILYCDSLPQGELNRALLVLQSSGRASLNYGMVSYELCQPGSHYNDFNLSCLLCQPAKYVNVEGAGKCVFCDSGMYANTTGKSVCDSCTPGYFSLYGSSGCSSCLPGNVTTSDAADECIPCDVGRYNNITASSVCENCAPGSYADKANSANCEFCPRGTFALTEGTKKCFSCPEGRYTNVTGSSFCELCPAGTIPEKLFPLDEGFTTCVPCSIGSYNDVAGRPNCLPCPAGRYSFAEASSTCLRCSPGRFSRSERLSTCQNCTGGFFAAGEENVICSSCTVGRFSGVTADSCTDCPVGRYQTLPSQSQCISCFSGNYAPVEGSISCLECSPGRTATASGASSCFICKGGNYSNNPKEDCKICPVGRYSLEDKSSCLDCEIGAYNSREMSSTCFPCVPGRFSDSSRSVSCALCPLGKYVNSFGSLGCIDCEPGTYGTTRGQSVCNLCSPGSYQNKYAQLSCSLCEAGRASPSNKTAECSKCLPGLYSSHEGSLACNVCPFGSFQRSFGETSCLNCTKGTYALSQASSCEDCSTGTYNQGDGLSYCSICTPGRYQDQSKQTFCLLCEPGFYSTGSAPQCTQCAAKTIAASKGQSYCPSCPDGSSSDAKHVECICQAGFFSNYSLDSDSGFACIPCPAGAYCKFAGTRWDTLTTSKGYWRASTNSFNFYSCQFLANCLGGRNSTCANNRDGPVCALCRPGYEAFGNSCRPCGTQGATVTVFILLVILIVGLVIAMYYVVLKLDKNELRKLKKHAELQRFLEDQDIMEEFQMNDDENLEASTNGTPNRAPNFAYKMKILLGFFQISVGIAFAIEIPWPATFKEFIALFNIANFDIVQWTRVGCVVKTTYLSKHMIVGLTPIVIFSLILVFYLMPRYLRVLFAYTKGEDVVLKAEQRMKRVMRKFWKMFLFTLFLIYPTVSSIMVRLYACRTVEGISYLTSDYEVQCTSKEWFSRAMLGIIFVVVYPVGIMFLFGWILVENKEQLHTPEALIQFGFLYGAFNRENWWFEMADMMHKLFMTSILPLFPNSIVLQVGLGFLTLHMCSILLNNPYARKGDDRLHLLAQTMLFNMVLCGYVFRSLLALDENMDTVMSVVMIGMVIFLMSFVLFQILTVVKKIYKIRKRRKALAKKKGEKALKSSSGGIPQVAEQILKRRRDSLKMNRNPMFTGGASNQDILSQFQEQTLNSTRNLERELLGRTRASSNPTSPTASSVGALEVHSEEAKDARKPISRQFIPRQMSRHIDEED